MPRLFSVEKKINCVAEGMLCCEDGVYIVMVNAFDFDENMKIDEEKKAEDIETYGLWGFEKMHYITQEVYDALDLEYPGVAIGKGMITAEQLERVGEATAELDESYIRDEMK